MWGISLTCSLEAGGCFMFGFSLTHPMDVLTIPTAYQNKTKKQTKWFLFLWEYLLWKRKIINKKVLNSLTHLMLASFCMEFLLKKEKKAMKTKKCVCVRACLPACVRACVCERTVKVKKKQHSLVIMLSRVEAKVPSQAPQGDSWASSNRFWNKCKHGMASC